MNSRAMTMGSILLYVLSVAIALAWWFLAWQSGVLARLPARGSNIILGFGVIQLLASVVILFVLLQSLRSSAHAADAMTFALNAALLFANLAWCVTPILGGPLLILILILGIFRLYWNRRQPSALVH
jgi:hypothetical protein